VLYQGDSGWNFGASYKSQQDFENFQFNSVDESGLPRTLELDLDFPSIASLGAAYMGFEKWVLAADLRYIDYQSTDGFQEAKFNPDASVNGFGWDSIFVLALGAQYEIDDKWTARAGYAFNQNPIADEDSTFNLPAPAILEHHASLGVSYCFDEAWCLDIAYRHGFENSIEGPIGHPAMGTVPGSSVKNTMSTDSLIVGFRVGF